MSTNTKPDIAALQTELWRMAEQILTPGSRSKKFFNDCAAALDERQADALYAEIEAEQRHGRQKYGDAPDDYAHDDNNSEAIWAACIEDHNLRGLAATPMERRQHLVKVAGLAISAIQSLDRKRAALTQGKKSERLD